MRFVSSFLSTSYWLYNSTYQFINEQINHYGGYNKAFLLPYPLSYLKYLIKSRKVNKNYNDKGYNPLHTAAIFNLNQKERIELLLNYGVNVNGQEVGFKNTPLHSLIANENTEGAIFLINTTKKKNICINFNLPDVNNCTVLLLASKTRQEETALHILKQKIEGNADIDIHIIDKNGMTALDYAIILGLISLTTALIELGAKTNSIKPDLSNLSSFNGPVIRKMLEEVEIDPDRAANAKLNKIHDRNKTLWAMICSASNPSPHPNPLPIPSKKDPKTGELINRLQDPLGPLLDSSTLNTGAPGWMSSEDKKFILDQYNGLSKKSLEKKCLENQEKIRKLFKERYVSSIFSSNLINSDASKNSSNSLSQEISQPLTYSYQSQIKEEKKNIVNFPTQDSSEKLSDKLKKA